MTSALTIIFILAAIFLIALISVLIVKGRMPIKYSIIWYLFAILLLLVGIIPDFFISIIHFLGFETMANFLALFVVAILILCNIALTVIIAGQHRRLEITAQELALLRKEITDVKK